MFLQVLHSLDSGAIEIRKRMALHCLYFIIKIVFQIDMYDKKDLIY